MGGARPGVVETDCIAVVGPGVSKLGDELGVVVGVIHLVDQWLIECDAESLQNRL